MMKTLIAAGALLALPAVAHAEVAPQYSFVSDGVDYTYTVEHKANMRVVRGAAYHGRLPFELHVTKAGVDGYVGESPVSFSMAEVQRRGGAIVAMAR